MRDPVVAVFYSDAYVAAEDAFDTTRKARWVADSLTSRPIPGIGLVPPEPATRADLLLVHDAAYVDAVRTGEPRELAESSGFAWGPRVWTAVTASTGGAVAAALQALRSGGAAGSLSSGLHHARGDRGGGFCTFNGLAVAARRAIAEGARSVLIVDLDAHCGGGTADILAGDPAVACVDVAVDAFDLYAERGRFTLDTILHAEDYLPTLRRRLGALDTAGVGLVLYNAGMDVFEGCATGGRRGVTAAMLEEREDIVFGWCRTNTLPVAFVLAGGYTGRGFGEYDLVQLHRMTLMAASRRV